LSKEKMVETLGDFGSVNYNVVRVNDWMAWVRPSPMKDVFLHKSNKFIIYPNWMLSAADGGFVRITYDGQVTTDTCCNLIIERTGDKPGSFGNIISAGVCFTGPTRPSDHRNVTGVCASATATNVRHHHRHQIRTSDADTDVSPGEGTNVTALGIAGAQTTVAIGEGAHLAEGARITTGNVYLGSAISGAVPSVADTQAAITVAKGADIGRGAHITMGNIHTGAVVFLT
jgi:hypothetical protein